MKGRFTARRMSTTCTQIAEDAKSQSLLEVQWLRHWMSSGTSHVSFAIYAKKPPTGAAGGVEFHHKKKKVGEKTFITVWCPKCWKTIDSCKISDRESEQPTATLVTLV